MTFESATTVLVTCLALGSLAVGLALVLLSLHAPQPKPVRVRADDGLRTRGERSPFARGDRDAGCNGIDR